MEPLRSLRDLFADLAGDESARLDQDGDVEGFLAANGYPDLPGGLVAEAIVSYADTAPAEVAEHLAPFVKVHSAVPLDDPGVEELDASQGLDLLASAPTALEIEDDSVDSDDFLAGSDIEQFADDPFGLDFGQGESAVDGEAAPDAPDEPDQPDEPDIPTEAASIEPDVAPVGSLADDNGLLAEVQAPEPDDGADDGSDDEPADF